MKFFICLIVVNVNFPHSSKNLPIDSFSVYSKTAKDKTNSILKQKKNLVKIMIYLYFRKKWLKVEEKWLKVKKTWFWKYSQLDGIFDM